jgi:acetyl-CoA synthetase
MRPSDVYWCTADVGWVTGHSYVVYGPLAAGATTLIYEGAPDFPTFHRFWGIIEKEKVSIFYTAPTAIRAFMRQGEEFPKSCNLSSLRLLGSVGEPINPEAWMWYHRVIGGERCPVVDTWWQTETGGIMISPLPGVTATKPGSATQPLPGIFPAVVDATGKPVPAGSGGKLVVTKPWPSALRTVYRDPNRYKAAYWSEIGGPGGLEKDPYYFTGDGARCDKDGYFWLMGRIDDVINVAGHRLGTAEIESALVSHPHVAEAAVVGKPDELKGTSICAFVTPKKEFKGKISVDELKKHVSKEIGALARPDAIRFTDALPKTRSGKIMRRLLRDIAAGRETVGDTTTLEDLSVLSGLRDYQDEG